jgi:hypothetical protein
MEDFRKIFLMKYILKLIFDRIKKKKIISNSINDMAHQYFKTKFSMKFFYHHISSINLKDL